MKWKVLTNRDQWDETIALFEHLDVFYAKEYIDLYSEEQSGVPEAIYYEDRNLRIFYPFLKRKIDYANQEYFDTVTVGFGGPHIEGNSNGVSHFYQLFSEYCQQNHIITETVRFHPLDKNNRFFTNHMNIDYIRLTAAVDLLPTMEEIRNSYRRDKRTKIRKTKDLNIEIVESSCPDHFEIFQNLYYETMNRTRATSNYYYSSRYFQELLKETSLCKPRLLLAKLEDQIVSGVLLLIGKKYAHYQLGASTQEALRLGINVKLMDYMIQYAKEQGAQVLHLGPGMKENDSLYEYKSTLSNMVPFQYYIGKKIHNPFVYEQLIRDINKEKVLETPFFPLYRA